MRKIVVKNFKAFHYKFELKLEKGKNALICGENGAGKSSLFYAIRYAYLHEDILSNLSIPGTPVEDVTAAITDYKAALINQTKREQPFEITINNTDAESFEYLDEIACFVSREMVHDRKKLSLLKLAEIMLASKTKAREFVTANASQIIDSVNDALHNQFYERISIAVLSEGEWDCQLIDDKKGLDGISDNLDIYFNEARLNLVTLLVMLRMAKIQFEQSSTSKKLLVCDDLVTSLDMANRQMMINYVLDIFPDEQKIIFTHNVSFFNLFQYIINVKLGTSVDWHFYGMYEVANRHRIYEYEKLSVANIKKKLAEGKSVQSVGNEIRRYFEVLLVELSRVHYTETSIEKIDHLLQHLQKTPSVYVLEQGNKIKYSDDLVKEIETLLANAPASLVIGKINALIQSYKKVNTDLQPLPQTLKSLEIFQKLVLHPLSHSSSTYPSVSIREEMIILDIMAKIEKIVNKGKNKNGSTGNVTDM